MVELIVERARREDEGSESEAFRLWGIGEPSGDALDRLVNELYLPILKRGTEGVQTGLEYLSLVRDVKTRALRDQIREGLLGGAVGEELEARRQRLQEVGYLRKPFMRGWEPVD